MPPASAPPTAQASPTTPAPTTPAAPLPPPVQQQPVSPPAAAGPAAPPPASAPGTPPVGSAAVPPPAAAAPSTPAAPAAQVAVAPPVARGAQPTARVGFSGESTDVPAEARTELRGVVDQMKRSAALRLRIEGFAGGEDANRSRRVSLSRALAIRGYLMDQGIASTRMDVYARGAIADGGPVDRVDLTTFRR